jgi:hypothetical protein
MSNLKSRVSGKSRPSRFVYYLQVTKTYFKFESFMTLGCSKKSRTSKVGSSTSRRIHHIFNTTSLNGRTVTHNEALNPSAILARQARDQVQYRERIAALPLVEIEELEAIRRVVQDEDDNWEDDNILRIDDILAGNASLDISHGGGEFVDLAELTEITDDLFGPSKR